MKLIDEREGTTVVEKRILHALSRDRKAAIDTRQLAGCVFNRVNASLAEIVATRKGLRDLEGRKFIRRVVQGERPGQPIWMIAPIFVSEGDNGRKAYFTAGDATAASTRSSTTFADALTTQPKVKRSAAMELFSWISGDRTSRLIVNHLNVMLGPKTNRYDSIRVLIGNPYLIGYVLGRISMIIVHSTSNLSPTRRDKLIESVVLELFLPNIESTTLTAGFNIAMGDPEFTRGQADAVKVGQYLSGGDYSSDPDLPKALEFSKPNHKMAHEFGIRLSKGKGERYDVARGLDLIYFYIPFQNASRELATN